MESIEAHMPRELLGQFGPFIPVLYLFFWDREGKNALDAAVLAYSSVSALRQQLKPEVRVHGIIEGRDWVPNGEFISVIVLLPMERYLSKLFLTMRN